MHERVPEPDARSIPNLDIELSESFPEENEFLFVLLTAPLAKLIEGKPAITDCDVREALESLVKTWRTLQSGLIYEQLPTNPHAADVAESVRDAIEEIRKRVAESNEGVTLSDTRVLHTLVFMQRLEYARNNGRRKSRAFVDAVTRPFRNGAFPVEDEYVVEPDEPRIIL